MLEGESLVSLTIPKQPPNYDIKVETVKCPDCGTPVNVRGGARAAHKRACGKERRELAVWTPEELTLS